MKKRIISLVTILMCLLLSGCGAIKDDIYILYTSDIHGAINNGIGYAGVKELKRSLNKEHRYVSLIDGGDFSQGSNVVDKSKGEAAIDIMNKAGYDVISLGNHEFDYGLDNLSNNIDKADFDVVDCNLAYVGSGKNPFNKVNQYVIKKYGSVKVAYIGILTQETVFEESESYKNCLENGEIVVDLNNIPNTNYDLSLFEQIQQLIDEAKSKADYVVVISHLGLNNKQGITSSTFVKNTRNVDIVLDAHAHSMSNEYRNNIDEQPVLFVSVGIGLDRVGQICIKQNGEFEASFIEEYSNRDVELQNYIDELINKYE